MQYYSNVSPMGYVLPEMLSAFLLEDTGLYMLVVVGKFFFLIFFETMK